MEIEKCGHDDFTMMNQKSIVILMLLGFWHNGDGDFMMVDGIGGGKCGVLWVLAVVVEMNATKWRQIASSCGNGKMSGILVTRIPHKDMKRWLR